MKPRILKKLCKKVVALAPDLFPAVYVETEPFADLYYSSWGLTPGTAPWKQTRHRHNSLMTHCIMEVARPDYFGELDDPRFPFVTAREQVLWEFGTRTIAIHRDEHGNVIMDRDDWPEYKRRLTGKEVIRLLKIRRDRMKCQKKPVHAAPADIAGLVDKTAATPAHTSSG